ncbi:rhodanese-like domain-containing protein [Pseudodesulfovibrio sp. zrk46]|uniref:rhodanese-like domain-containing protein n=1 Tax=Pseudodesulfovibrio sp. zrk46 TaxID=2725288 RepID=UPI001449A2EB|nr:rhodanese-like domain-containing protein [Pseudodesulfovibrio sp. zrk46]QJB58227.1 sulfurtransferase [Pseudodesulfovibrio sp. zrk46]
MTNLIKMFSTDQAKQFLDANKPDSYMLIDVRQEWEYEEFHLPGAYLIPLVDLADRLDEVVTDKPVLVYCRSGGRSMAAAILLEGQGFKDLTNMVGGVMAWQGDVAYGPMELGMAEFTGNETPEEIVFKAYAMEESLRVFYLGRADYAETLERIELFTELAEFEEKHKKTLFNLYGRMAGAPLSREEFERKALQGASGAAEGGIEIEAFLEEFGGAFEGDTGMLELASMIEAQALDYYLRCAMQAESTEAKDMFQLLAREEKAHLKVLARHMVKRQGED